MFRRRAGKRHNGVETRSQEVSYDVGKMETIMGIDAVETA